MISPGMRVWIVLLSALALGAAFVVGRLTAPTEIPGVVRPEVSPTAGEPLESLPRALTGKVPRVAIPPSAAATKKNTAAAGSTAASGAGPYHPILGLEAARAVLAQFRDPEQRQHTIAGMRISDEFGSAKSVLASKELNPQGLRLPDARMKELDEALSRMRAEELEHLLACEELMARADVQAFERGTVVVWENKEFANLSLVEEMRKLRAREQEFERRYGKVGKNMFWKSYSAGPRPGTHARVIYRRRTHPEIFAAVDAIGDLRKRRREFIRSFLERFGYR